MKLKNVKVNEQYIIKSLEHSYVGLAPFKIGDIHTVDGLSGSGGNTVTFLNDSGRKWDIHHKDIEQVPIQYTHPMQKHLGKEVITTLGRGFVVSTGSKLTDLYLLVDYGDGFIGHNGGHIAKHQQATNTCGWAHYKECKFLKKNDE
jgi:hypothetical protein